MKIDNFSIPLEMWQLEELLEKRIERMGLKISDLFLVWSSEATKPLVKNYDTMIETKYGKLRVFITENCPKEKGYICHKSRFNYPNQSNPFTSHGNLLR